MWFVNLVRSQTAEYKPQEHACKDREGNIITDERKILQRWKEYFHELLNNDSEINLDDIHYYSADQISKAHLKMK